MIDADFKILTLNKTKTVTIDNKIKKIHIPNVVFINYEAKYLTFPTPYLVGHSLGVDYTIKGKWRIGLAFEKNKLAAKNLITNFKIGIKL